MSHSVNMTVPLKDVVEAMVKDNKAETVATLADTKAKDPAFAANGPSIRSRIGAFANATSMQLLVSTLLYLASFSSAILATLPHRTTYVTVMILKGALQAFASFNSTLFVLEILTQIYVRGLMFFKHPGFILDLVTTGTTVYSQSVPTSPIKPGHTHALSFLRYWRLVAIVIRIIANVEASHDSTIAKLAESQAANKKLKAQLRFMEDRRGDDAQHRSDVEALCVEYKNEIDTLMAALQLAAQDVAKGGGGISGTDRTFVDSTATNILVESEEVVKVKVEKDDGAGATDGVSIDRPVGE